MKKIGFVVPWYHKDIRGGAEQELRGIVTHLKANNVDLEIITTCVKEFTADWTENYFKEGVEIVDGIPIRRFKVRKGNMKEFHRINAKVMQGKTISYDEEDIFIREMVNSPDMYDYLREHSEEYHRYVFIPYMFGTTYYGILACPFKSILIPCLHDEAYAYFRHYRETFRDLRGIIFHARPEMELANKVLDLRNVNQVLLGEGVETDFEYNADRFRKKYNINEPYIPENIKDKVVDLGFLDIQDKYDACAGSVCLCQPSKNESFSIVIMESWLCERPVLVNAACNVTANFAKESNSGLYFNDYFEFEGCVNYYMDNPVIAETMGKTGRQFVLDNFKWDVIVKRFLDFFES